MLAEADVSCSPKHLEATRLAKAALEGGGLQVKVLATWSRLPFRYLVLSWMQITLKKLPIHILFCLLR